MRPDDLAGFLDRAVDPADIAGRARFMRDLSRLLGVMIRGVFGRPMGFTVFLFDFGMSGRMDYASNGTREDVTTTLVEHLGRQHPEVLQAAIERWRQQGLLGPGAERPQ